MNRRRFLLLATVIAAVGLAGTWGYGVISRRAVIRAHLPPVPTDLGWPAELNDPVADAVRAASSWFDGRDGLVLLSRLHHANGGTSGAIACYEALRRIDPTEARWPHLEAALLADLGQLPDALALERRAVALAPDYPAAQLRLGDLLLKAGKSADAAEVYRTVLQRSTNEPYALLGLARVEMGRGDWVAARARLVTATEHHPDFIGGLVLLVTIHERLGDPAAAQAIQERIGKRQHADPPDPWLEDLWTDCHDGYRLSVAAAIAGSAGNHRQARQLLERAILLDPKTSVYRRNLAQVFLATNDPGAARAELEQATRLAPGDADAWLLLVESLRRLGQAAAAAQALRQGLALSPESAGLRLELARELTGQGRFAEAIPEFRTAIALRPGEAGPLVELADTCFAAGEAEAGLAALKQALTLQPGHPLALTSLAFYHIVTGNDAAARRVWQEIRQQPRTPSALLERLRGAYRQQFNRELP